MSELDQSHMRRALRLALRGQGAVEPNPMVGAVVAQGAAVVGEGWHRRFGGPHAEVEALDFAGPAARGATLYVTLEPCCHHGKTPPCTDRVISSGVARVVCAMLDPFEQVAGRGVQLLRERGIVCDVGCLAPKSRQINAPYLKLLTKRRPLVHAKWAMSLDGKIATAAGESKWISNETSRRHAHQFRGTVDAIIVGIGTALADDPSLTARPAGPRIATRVVLDSYARLPLDSQLVATARQIPTLIATTASASPDKLDALRDAGCECLLLPESAFTSSPSDGFVGGIAIGALLDELGRRRFTNVLVEGGAGALGAFLSAGEIDAVRIYIAPRLIGGAAAPSPFGGAGIAELAKSLRLTSIATLDLDGDLFLQASRAEIPA